MDDVEALQGTDPNPAGAVADRIADLELQLAQLTQMFRSGVKVETMSGAERQSVQDALLEARYSMKQWPSSTNRRKNSSWRSGWRCNSSRTRFMIMWNPGKRPVLCMCI